MLINYTTAHYNGDADTANTHDNVFVDSLENIITDSITGNPNEGYTLSKTIIVNG